MNHSATYGFQGSEKSWVEVIFYLHNDGPVVFTPDGGGEYTMDGRYATDPYHSIVSVSVTKDIGTPSGSWSVTLKPGLNAQPIFEWLVDDDWVDIVFYRHDQPWHVMRGLVDRIDRQVVTTKTGATMTAYTISGREWSKIFETTPVWFSPYANNDLVTDGVAHEVFRALPQVVGSPPTAVEAYLKGFMEALTTSAGVNWAPPKGMPGIVNDSFLESVTFQKDYFRDFPSRIAFNPNYMQPQGTLWELARQHSDPLFVELYADLLPDGDPFSPDIADSDPIHPGDANMTIVIRDRPFPVIDSEITGSYTHPWDAVPVSTVPRQQIVSSTIGKHGYERFNAYFLASLLTQEALGVHALSILAPLVDLTDIKRHGMRRMDIQSQQGPSPASSDYGTMTDQQRRIIRDWYCLNPYLLSGNIQLGIGRPDLKVGTRAKIPGMSENGADSETYYIESINNLYTFPAGTRTSLGVTRGWVGSDDRYYELLEKVSAGYTIPVLTRNT